MPKAELIQGDKGLQVNVTLGELIIDLVKVQHHTDRFHAYIRTEGGVHNNATNIGEISNSPVVGWVGHLRGKSVYGGTLTILVHNMILLKLRMSTSFTGNEGVVSNA